MFMLRNVGKYIFGDTSKESIIEIPQGQLYLVRPLSPKGYSELIFKDAAASIRRTAQEFQYQLIVQRAYEEGEEELLADEDADDDGGASGGGLSASGGLAGSDKDEKVFLLDESLRFRAATRASGEKVFAWRDLSGDLGDHYEFVCDRAVQPAAQGTFELVAIQCQFERKYRRSHQKATEAELRQFAFSDSFLPSSYPATTTVVATSAARRTSSDAPAAAAASTSTTRTTTTTFVSPAASAQKGRRSTGQPEPAEEDDNDVNYDDNDAGADADEDNEDDDEEEDEDDEDEMAGKAAKGAKRDPRDTVVVAPPSAAHPKALNILVREKAELHLFDFNSGSFILQDSQVTAVVSETGPWQYWLQVTGSNKEWLGQPVVADINPVFNFEYLSFIFNHYTTEGAAYSWLLRFKDQEAEERFQQGLMQALWEQLNEVKWSKAKDDDREYILEAFQDLTMGDAGEGEEEEDEEEQEDEYEEEEGEGTDEEEEEAAGAGDGRRSEHYDSDEEEDDVVTGLDADGNVNSQLAVGYKHDRSFVVRGPKIGVFKHTPDNNLEFSTSISRVETPNGKLFSPKKVMLHAEDSNMILQNADNPHSLYRMDLEYGKVVDEWKIDDDIPVTNFSPEKKFSQMTNEQTFLGLSHNALFRIDPRLTGNKLVGSQLKQYASKNDFSATATTAQGYIAVASNKGDVRLFDRLGINAKSHLPALGEPIVGLDVSADGRWVLATCRTYLLLIDALQKEGSKHAGKLGFERAFARDAKPQPRRLTLQPEHVAQMQHETRGQPLQFTPARFNTGTGAAAAAGAGGGAGGGAGETSIITATGPFVVTWSLRKVLAGRRDPYSIKRYAENVMADDFKFGTDSDVIVALPNEVNMVPKRTLRKPTRESIAPGHFGAAGGAGGASGGAGGAGVSGAAAARRSMGGAAASLSPAKRAAGRLSSSKLSRSEVVNSPY